MKNGRPEMNRGHAGKTTGPAGRSFPKGNLAAKADSKSRITAPAVHHGELVRIAESGRKTETPNSGGKEEGMESREHAVNVLSALTARHRAHVGSSAPLAAGKIAVALPNGGTDPKREDPDHTAKSDPSENGKIAETGLSAEMQIPAVANPPLAGAMTAGTNRPMATAGMPHHAAMIPISRL